VRFSIGGLNMKSMKERILDSRALLPATSGQKAAIVALVEKSGMCFQYLSFKRLGRTAVFEELSHADALKILGEETIR
jgi:hypothetical protein